MPSTELFDPPSNDPSAPPDGPLCTEKDRPGLGGSLLASTSASASTMICEFELCPEDLEFRPEHLGWLCGKPPPGAPPPSPPPGPPGDDSDAQENVDGPSGAEDSSRRLLLKKKQYFEDPDPNPKRTNKFEKLGWNADFSKFYYRGSKGVFWLNPDNYLDKDEPASAISDARGNKHQRATRMDDAALAQFKGTLIFIADELAKRQQPSHATGAGSSSSGVAPAGGPSATPASKAASAPSTANSSVDSEAVVNANAQARANPADRMLRAEVRAAKLLFAPGGDGAVAAAEEFALTQAQQMSATEASEAKVAKDWGAPWTTDKGRDDQERMEVQRDCYLDAFAQCQIRNVVEKYKDSVARKFMETLTRDEVIARLYDSDDFESIPPVCIVLYDSLSRELVDQYTFYGEKDDESFRFYNIARTPLGQSDDPPRAFLPWHDTEVEQIGRVSLGVFTDEKTAALAVAIARSDPAYRKLALAEIDKTSDPYPLALEVQKHIEELARSTQTRKHVQVIESPEYHHWVPLGVAFASVARAAKEEYPPKGSSRVVVRFVGQHGKNHIPTYRACYVVGTTEIELCFFAIMWHDQEDMLRMAREDLNSELAQKYDEELRKMKTLITSIALTSSIANGRPEAGCAHETIERMAHLTRGAHAHDIRPTDARGAMPSFLRKVNALSTAWEEEDIGMVKELWQKTNGVVLDDEGFMDFDGQYGFEMMYYDSCKPLTHKPSDVTFKGLARFGITKFYDFPRDMMCVAGFSRFPGFASYCNPQASLPRPVLAEDSASNENRPVGANGQPIARFGGKRPIPRLAGPSPAAKRIKRDHIR